MVLTGGTAGLSLRGGETAFVMHTESNIHGNALWNLLYFKGWRSESCWRLEVCGGWQRLLVGGWQLAVGCDWQRLAVGGGWWLAVGGGWRLMGAILKGCP